jgi:hypothetical protein
VVIIYVMVVCDRVWYSGSLQAFRRNLLPEYSGYKGKELLPTRKHDVMTENITVQIFKVDLTTSCSTVASLPLTFRSTWMNRPPVNGDQTRWECWRERDIKHDCVSDDCSHELTDCLASDLVHLILAYLWIPCSHIWNVDLS